MPAKTPVVSPATAGYVVPGLGVYGGVNTSTANLLTGTAEHHANRNGLQLSIFYFGPSASGFDIDDTDTWTSGIKGIVAVAWQGSDPDDDAVVPFLSTAATGVVTFQSESANSEGWLWVLHST